MSTASARPRSSLGNPTEGDGSSSASRLAGELPEQSPETGTDVDSESDSAPGLRQNLRASLFDSAAFNVMVGLGESFIPAFVLALGLGGVAAGLVISVPVVAGSLLQLISPWAVKRLGSHRRWVVGCIMLQAASFLPLAAGAFYGSMPVWLVFGIVALYWAGGLGAVPAWNAWMESLVPGHVRAPFFAMRSRVGQAGLAAGFVIGGISLEVGKGIGPAKQYLLPAFGVMFLMAAAARFCSALLVRSQHEGPAGDSHVKHVPFREICRRIKAGGSERILVYFLAVQVAIQCSGPYFAPYMLHQMKVGYIHFMILLGVAFLGKIIMFPISGRLAARYGTHRLLWIGGLAIIPVAGLWLYADTFWKIALVQFIAGLCWAPYELAVFLMFFEMIRREERTSIMTTFNFWNSAALASASIAGGAFLKLLGECPPAYLSLFVLSSCLRCFTPIFLRLVPKQMTNDDEPGTVVPVPAFAERKRTAPVRFADASTVAAPPE